MQKFAHDKLGYYLAITCDSIYNMCPKTFESNVQADTDHTDTGWAFSGKLKLLMPEITIWNGSIYVWYYTSTTLVIF